MVTVPEDYPDDLIKRVAITSSIYPDPNTHIETVTYGDDGDSMHRLYTLLVGDGTRVTRPLKWLVQVLLHPKRLAQVLFPKHYSRRTIIILVMQTLDNAIALRPRKGPFGSLWLKTEQDPEKPIPTFIPVANQAAEWFAKRTGGIAQSSTTEALFNIPTTAHILGGAVIAPDPSRGVVDARQRVFGYENLLVCDGSAIPANVGVNPSLTITALAEHAMSHIPAAGVPELARAAADGGSAPSRGRAVATAADRSGVTPCRERSPCDRSPRASRAGSAAGSASRASSGRGRCSRRCRSRRRARRGRCRRRSRSCFPRSSRRSSPRLRRRAGSRAGCVGCSPGCESPQITSPSLPA